MSHSDIDKFRVMLGRHFDRYKKRLFASVSLVAFLVAPILPVMTVHAAGNTAVMVKDIVADSSGSSPASFTRANDIMFFTAYDGVSSNQLWKSDGSPAGTVALTDSTDPNFNASQLTDVNGTLFFSAGSVRQLWKSDGTVGGTALVHDFGQTTATGIQYLTSVNGALFFSHIASNGHIELWKSDGTTAGTVLVYDFGTGGAGYSIPMKLTNVSGTLFFVVSLGHGAELWKSDGTGAGTTLVFATNSNTFPNFLTSANGTLFFTANDGTHGLELWKSDGTTAGTSIVKDINLGAADSSPSSLVNINGTVFFGAYTGNGTDQQLWKTDGTSSGTSIVANINTGAGGLRPYYLTNINGELFFVGDDGTHGSELWKSDGSSASTVMVADINGNGSANIQDITNANGTVFFWANDGVHGLEPWETDGTTSGTYLVKDIKDGSDSSYPGIPRNAGVLNGTVFFSADDGTHGLEPWKTAVAPSAATQLTLSPASATGVVGNTATFTATANNNGIPVGNLTIRYGVSGSTTANGSCTTDANGQCSFSYTGPQLAGTDQVSAYADNNANNQQDQGEPAATATMTWQLPASTQGQVSGTGTAPGSTSGQIIFNFSATSTGGGTSGQCAIIDLSALKIIQCTTVSTVVIAGDHATIFGNGTVNGQSTAYRIDVMDNGTPGGGTDTFSIRTASGYSAGGTLGTGDVNVP